MRLVTVFNLGGNWREGFDAINSADHQICCSQRGWASLLINAPLWIDNATYPLIDCLIRETKKLHLEKSCKLTTGI
ncbi:unnamed protein product [Sphagnum troendelagicum]|uniref:Uncharacterized protein n=1 Tax=Sphagnum troendelagicum TaxID=128251 RepID=A0ABP0U299_9BRYO